ncbi:nucleotidyl transferase AbiEii/AbiGii toxin family protein [Levilactobacillus cerevisiae]|uniref:nucleotidyl transferase AbiEii/AbiGii toxin family protein n=1 Tax=Levilactobacillus cerevisiae TaxID=1704076 RepID=UPI0013DE671F|nr:nucleotidyl transferase AbiEii/AbiGii toxin family protein [Levilactobacillus cerevisiae]
MARTEHIAIQDLQSRYAAERLLARIEVSPYRNELILKGGYLIGAIIGIGQRSTRDLDYSANLVTSQDELTQILTTISAIPLADDVSFQNLRVVENLKSSTHYNPGYKLHLNLKMANPDPSRPTKPITFKLKIDLTLNDLIIPEVQRFQHISEIDGSVIQAYAYPVEQILAEKISACLAHGDQNTRTRDYYDIYALSQFEGNHLDYHDLYQSIVGQFNQHQQQAALTNPIVAFQDLGQSTQLITRWNHDKQQFLQTNSDVSFDATISAAIRLLQLAGFSEQAPLPPYHPWLTD